MDTIPSLLQKYLKEELSDAEQQELNSWVSASDENRRLFESLSDSEYVTDQVKRISSFNEEAGWEKVKAHTRKGDEHQDEQKGYIVEMPAKTTKGRRVGWIGYAAAIAGLLMVGLLFTKNKKEAEPAPLIAMKNEKIVPAGNKAILTLANGSTIVLDEAGNGVVASQGGVKVTKLNNELLTYQDAQAGATVVYNTITTPRGGVYQLILPDGTHAWLNASSSLRFPTVFTGDARQIELTGEGYFEVTKDASRPFHVKAGAVDIAVLGTHFNIMAYPEEKAVRTTLLEGSVKVSSGNSNNIIVPGEQASLANGGTSFKISHPDIEQVLAWKQGEFKFDNMDFKSILRQVERWYDVDVIYTDNIANKAFTGDFSRRKDIVELLGVLEESGYLHFKIEGRKIYVLSGLKK